MSALFSGWRRDLANWLLGGGYLGLALIGFELRSTTGWMLAAGLILPASAWAWHANLKRYRMIVDTPTARIASAPQGYVEFVGRGRQPPGAQLLHPFTHLPCLWYRYRVEERRDNKWRLVDSGESGDTFGLDDGSGLVLVDPEHAEIVCTRKQVSQRAAQRITDWSLLEGDTLYVLGDYVTLGSHEQSPGRRERLSERLTELKRDPAELRRRFDANRDGQIDQAEWDAARAAVERELDRAIPSAPQAEVRLIRRPRDGRPYLVANRDVAELARHYRRWSSAHFVVLAAAVTGLVLFA